MVIKRLGIDNSRTVMAHWGPAGLTLAPAILTAFPIAELTPLKVISGLDRGSTRHALDEIRVLLHDLEDVGVVHLPRMIALKHHVGVVLQEAVELELPLVLGPQVELRVDLVDISVLNKHLE